MSFSTLKVTLFRILLYCHYLERYKLQTFDKKILFVAFDILHCKLRQMNQVIFTLDNFSAERKQIFKIKFD